jgi:hypothetical protein
MAQHSNYWSCTPFADWVRGTRKLKSGTSEEWYDWNSKAKGYNPVRYWLAEEGLDKLQDFSFSETKPYLKLPAMTSKIPIPLMRVTSSPK